jgi:hypothetical protein
VSGGQGAKLYLNPPDVDQDRRLVDGAHAGEHLDLRHLVHGVFGDREPRQPQLVLHAADDDRSHDLPEQVRPRLVLTEPSAAVPAVEVGLGEGADEASEGLGCQRADLDIRDAHDAPLVPHWLLHLLPRDLVALDEARRDLVEESEVAAVRAH